MDTEINYQTYSNSHKCKQLFSTVLQPNMFDEYFICGPNEMIFTIKDFLFKRTVVATNIHFELFTAYPIKHKQSCGYT